MQKPNCTLVKSKRPSSVTMPPTSNEVGDLKSSCELKGWLNKWTNYIKGYQKRWFVLSNGALSYYRNQFEVGQTCRGSINLQGAFIHTEDSCNFVISNGTTTQTFHLKASSEVERQKWVTALELARVRAIREAESDEEEEMKLENALGSIDKNEVHCMTRVLQSKLDDLLTCQDIITKHGSSLQKSLSEVEQISNGADLSAKVRTIHERATLFRITIDAMINACHEYVDYSQSQGCKWIRLLQHEHRQRITLQEQLEQLARQLSALERAAMKEAKDHGGAATFETSIRRIFVFSDDVFLQLIFCILHITGISDDESDVYHDAEEALSSVDNFNEEEYLDADSTMKSSGNLEYSTNSGNLKFREVRNKEEEEGGEEENGNKIDSYRFAVRQSTQGITNVEFSKPKSKEALSQRRQCIPPKPNVPLNLWSIMKNCIGKELSKIPMPVNTNEPLSMLQRLTEDLEYSNIVDQAAQCGDVYEQMCYVAAFTVSSYSTTTNRTGKPFNPLLGETYEWDRTDDLGWRSLCEQVSHHPPAAALHAESQRWKLWQEFTMSSKFRGKYLSIVPLGYSHLEFLESGNYYIWRKVTTVVHNIIVGKLWIDNYGDMTIEEKKHGVKCHLKYIPYSYFSKDTPRKVTGVVTDKDGVVYWVLKGTWDDHMECAKVIGQSEKHSSTDKPVYETMPPKLLWKRNPPLPGAETFYNFTLFAVQLNEEEEGVAPTDSRNRPDQRLMELGNFEDANLEKIRLEEKQRAARKQREIEAEQAISGGREYKGYEPVWFTKHRDPWTGNIIHSFNGKYWEHKSRQDWSNCPDIY
ncbi:Oxysterol-binding protein 1 [Trichinella pseudospiralis]|uniref:Oxysterol-binding protein n=1 Tax=Trichinella pseudospiralis TaxID=6337 RepID=A0A0V0YJI3_TRIPS|nr:Oxysterol-binding protein 1 [Trichinella pseudospiralis]